MDSTSAIAAITAAIRDIPDFPRPGITFKDITPVLRDPALFRGVIDVCVEVLRPYRIEHVVGLEARGFILAAPIAYALGAGFVPARKKGKLPGAVRRSAYKLEYGTDCLEMHDDALRPGARTVIVDDVIATGGTAVAAGNLVQELGGELLGYLFLIELIALGGRKQLPETLLCKSLIRYEN